MEHPSCLAPEQLRALARLSEFAEKRRFYLAGGTAVALHLQHRRSVDLDLFSRETEVNLGELARGLVAHLDGATVVSITDATLTLKLGDLGIDLVKYPYPLLEEPTRSATNFPVASLRDLAAMKLSAIAKRGLRRDFWDLHEIATRSNVDLRSATEAYLARFGVYESDLYHVIRSLTYFDDAEAVQVMPLGLTLAHWGRIKDYFVKNSPDLIRGI